MGFKEIFKKYKSSKPQAQKVYNVVALGNTGVGKSSLLNMLGCTEMFKVGEEADAQTEISFYNTNKLPFMGEPNEINLCLIDTPGLCDGKGDDLDVKHIENIVERLRELKQIDLFILCLEYTNPRFTASIKSTIQLFMNMFPDFIRHTVIVFNKSFNLSPDIRKKRIEAYKSKFKELDPNSDISLFFIDSNFNYKSDASTSNQSEIDQIKYDEIFKLKQYLVSKKSYCDVLNIVPVKTKWQETMERFRVLEEDLEKKRLEIIEANKKIERQEKLERKNKKRKKLVKIVGGGGGTATAAVVVILLIIFF